MKELLFSLCTVCIFSSAVTYLCPSGNSGIGKALRMLCSLCICACLISPAVKLMTSNIEEFIPPDTDTDNVENTAKNAIIDGAVELISAEMERYASSVYGITDPELILTVDSSDTSKIRITGGHLKGKGNLNEAASYISSVLTCGITYDKEDAH